MDINKKNREQLRSYFKSNATPTEQNFKDLIDAGFNQKEDGIAKSPAGPIALESSGTALETLHLYEKFTDNGPGWRIGQKGGDRKGLNITGPNAENRLFLDQATGNVSIGNTSVAAKLTLFEEKGSPPTPNSGTLLLDHGDPGGQTSIVFRSRVNAGSDFGYISYRDNIGSGESSALTIGNANDGDDNILLMASGNVGVGREYPRISLDVETGGIIGNADATPDQHIPANRGTKIRFGAVVNEYVGMDIQVKEGTNGCGNSGDILFQTWECGTSVTREVMRITGSGRLGVGQVNPSARLHVSAVGGGNPHINGLYVMNDNPNPGQDAILTARVNGAAAGNPFLSFDIAGITGWSMGIDNKDRHALKFSNNWGSLTAATRMTLLKEGNLGIGTTDPKGRLHLFENPGTDPNPNTGTLVLEHGNAGGTSSIVFKSNINNGSDFGYISYKDNQGSGENSLLTIGNLNDGDDHIALLPSGNVGIGNTNPSAKLTVKANGGNNPFNNGILIYNESGAASQDAIVTTLVNGAGAGNSFFAMDIGGVTGWSMGIDNKAAQSFKISNSSVSPANETKLMIRRNGQTGIGTTDPKGHLHVYEPTHIPMSAITGTLVLEHAAVGGQSSIVFPSRINYGSDHAFIRYEESARGGEASQMVIGIENDWDDHLILQASGSIGIGRPGNVPNPAAKVDIAGNIRINDGTQVRGHVLTTDADGFASWRLPQARRNMQPYGTPSYVWDGSTLTDSLGAEPFFRLSNRGAANGFRYNNNILWGNKYMLQFDGCSNEGIVNDAVPANGVYITVPATLGVHNSFLMSVIDWDRNSVCSVWLVDKDNNRPVKIMRSMNGTHFNHGKDGSTADNLASSYIVGPRNSMKETTYHAWTTYPITAAQVSEYIFNGNLKMLVTTGPNHTNGGTVFVSGLAMVPNPSGFVQHNGIMTHWGINGTYGTQPSWNNIWYNDNLIRNDANTTCHVLVKVVDPDRDLIVTFYEHNNNWYGGTPLITVGGDKTIFTPAAGIICCASSLYGQRGFMSPQSIIIPSAIFKPQLIRSNAGIGNMLPLNMRNPWQNHYYFRGVDTEIAL